MTRTNTHRVKKAKRTVKIEFDIDTLTKLQGYATLAGVNLSEYMVGAALDLPGALWKLNKLEAAAVAQLKEAPREIKLDSSDQGPVQAGSNGAGSEAQGGSQG